MSDKMTRKDFIKIFEQDSDIGEGDNALQGLLIINKYMPDSTVLCGAAHDVIWSVDIDDLIIAGISKEDTNMLRKLNWMIEGGEYLACFV